MACASLLSLLKSSTSQAVLLAEAKLTTPPDATWADDGLKLMLVELEMVTVRAGATCCGFIDALDISLPPLFLNYFPLARKLGSFKMSCKPGRLASPSTVPPTFRLSCR